MTNGLIESNIPIEETPWVIVDIDGTVANIKHRLHHIRGEGKKDWNAFNAALKDDDPKWNIIHLVQAMYNAGYNIAVVTGRDAKYRRETWEWLTKFKVPHDELYMRPENNNESDHIIKQRILNDNFKLKDRIILFVVDDRDRVVNMWRENGITCLQVQKGDY